jgi:capsular polysaccharide biosynthesis protein
MNTKKTTLRIDYWDTGKTREVCEKENGRVLEVAYFHQVNFVGHSRHYPLPLLFSAITGRLTLPTVEKFMSLGRGTIYEETMEYDINLPVKFNRFCNIPVFYFVYNVANYYHFIYDTLPYLYHYFNEKKIHPEMKLLMSPAEGKADLYPFVWESLKLLGIEKSDVIMLNPNTLYDKVCVGSSLTHNRLSSCPPHSKVFDIINRMKGEAKGPERIYVSRRTWMHNNLENIGTNYTERRRCVNEDSVAELFISQGFTEVFCENMTMEEKIAMFRAAKVVAGPIGGGMCNVIFSPSETKVISINSPRFFDVNYRFEFSMSHTDLHHFDYTEFTEEVEESVDDVGSLSISGGINSPWKVDIDKLSEFLNSCLT